MIAHKDFESNCKRIAKYIMKQASNPSSKQFNSMIDSGLVIVDVSQALATDVDDNKKKYVKEINNHLKGCSVTYSSYSLYPNCFIKFDIEFDDADAEMEDW